MDIDYFKEKMQSNSTDPDYWLRLEKEWNEFCSDDENRKLAVTLGEENWILLESFYMICSGIRFSQNNK